MCQIGPDSSLDSFDMNQPNSGYTRSKTFLNSTGNLRFLVVYVDFLDVKMDKSSKQEIELVQLPNLISKIDSMSYGKLKATFDIASETYLISKNSISYKLNVDAHVNAYPPGADFAGLVKDIGNAVEPNYDMTKYDSMLIVYPVGAQIGVTGVVSQPIVLDGKQFNQHIITNVVPTFDPNSRWLDKNWLLHEFGHTVGLPHPYPNSYMTESNGAYQIPAWSSMKFDDTFAPDYLGWEKYLLRWISDSQMYCLSDQMNDKLTLYLDAIGNQSGNKKIAVIRTSRTQAIVIESRRKSAVDLLESGDEGILVYRIDTLRKSDQEIVKVVTNNLTTRKFTNIYEHQPAKTFTFLTGTLKNGDSVTTDGYRISVIQADKSGDYISIQKTNF